MCGHAYTHTHTHTHTHTLPEIQIWTLTIQSHQLTTAYFSGGVLKDMVIQMKRVPILIFYQSHFLGKLSTFLLKADNLKLPR